MTTLSDRDAVVEVFHRYARAVDARDWDLMAEVFTDQASVEYTGRMVVVGRGEIVAAIRPPVEVCGPTQHLFANHEVTVDGDAARARCALRVFHVGVGPAAELTYEVFANCQGVLVRTPAGWRLSEFVESIYLERGSLEVFAGLVAPGE